MLPLPPHIILWDTEYTSWEGAQARKWSGPNEYRELVQIGAIRFNTEQLSEEDSLLLFIKPVRNPLLSAYFMDLTGITQKDVDEHGVSFANAADTFRTWIGDTPCYAYGHDKDRLDENYVLNALANPYRSEQFFDVREIFKVAGINTDNYMSSTIPEAFGKKNPFRGHDALGDARSIAEALKALSQEHVPKPPSTASSAPR